ncbi:hypothetical protein [Occallatibacter savannae]|uniref:hypothetical protein n=1 Tax=Occallatibacter savannae TaxID=1002691 RepID=UPI000D687D84|nr:hypothetical protein [Occallatibacter savannae]
MFEKQGKFYADWRDRTGRRLRKSFTTRRAALQFEAEQKELAHPKSKARGQRSPRYSAPSTSGSAPVTLRTRARSVSSPKLVTFRRSV